jgi:alpha-tubulin suppressor-like RCC1 family protein
MALKAPQKSMKRGMSGRGARREITDFAYNQADLGNDLYPVLTQVPIGAVNVYCQLACGEDFTLLLTSTGNVLSTGSGSFGLHCLENFKDRTEFASVGSETLNGGFFESLGIKQIAAGEAHCAALDK